MAQLALSEGKKHSNFKFLFYKCPLLKNRDEVLCIATIYIPMKTMWAVYYPLTTSNSLKYLRWSDSLRNACASGNSCSLFRKTVVYLEKLSCLQTTN